MAKALEVGTKILVEFIVKSAPDEDGRFNAVPASCENGGSRWQSILLADVREDSNPSEEGT